MSRDKKLVIYKRIINIHNNILQISSQNLLYSEIKAQEVKLRTTDKLGY